MILFYECITLQKKITNSLENLLDKARWSRGMILAKGTRGPGFKSRTSPLDSIDNASSRIDSILVQNMTLPQISTQ